MYYDVPTHVITVGHVFVLVHFIYLQLSVKSNAVFNVLFYKVEGNAHRLQKQFNHCVS